MKTCKKCKLTKPIIEFYKGKGCKDGLQTQCKDCINLTSQARHKRLYASGDQNYRNQKTKTSRKTSLRKNYGITPEIYKKMLSTQNNKCAVCDIDQSNVKSVFHVDHCHKTGKVRELLCYACNRAEGFVKSNSNIAIKLANYLIKHGALND